MGRHKQEFTRTTEVVLSDEDTPGLPEVPTPGFQAMSEAADQLTLMRLQAEDNAKAVAVQVGYEGPLTVGAVEDGIRFYQQRAADACIELGKRLLVLKELTPHGEFHRRIELLGITSRMAQRFMQAVFKFSKASTSTLLKAAETKSKMLELLVLDEGEIDALEKGDTVRGVTIDRIEAMSVSELRKALRNRDELLEARDTVIENQSKALARKDEQIEILQNRDYRTPEQTKLKELRHRFSSEVHQLQATVHTQIRKTVNEILKIDRKANIDGLAAQLIMLRREIALFCGEYHMITQISEDTTPEWMNCDITQFKLLPDWKPGEGGEAE